jgi:hypothetical protein
MESVMGKRKERASGKRLILRDKFVYTQPETLELLKAAERETKKRKKKGCTGSRKRKVPRYEVQSTSDDTDSQVDDEGNQSELSIMSEIEVEIHR